MHRPSEQALGPSLLRLVTSGMYDDPLALYREYLQNAADSAAESPKPGRVEIHLDPQLAQIRIRDYGPGLTSQEAIDSLIPVGQSTKDAASHRGFRGIGRLAGLPFAEEVAFTTRAGNDESPVRVTWDALRLRGDERSGKKLRVSDCVSVERLHADDVPGQYFEVEVRGVARYAAGSVLNRRRVHDYIAESCPVPLSTDFPFREQVEEHLGDVLYAMEVSVDGEGTVSRLHAGGVEFAGGRTDTFKAVETFDVPKIDSPERAAAGWIAHTSYLGAIPKGSGIRGIRARCGNIQVGGEGVFDHLFKEDRLNRWTVGEVHILDSRILPNGRRDYFEPGPHLRNLENHLGAIFRRLAERCRTTSATRTRERRLAGAIADSEEAYALARSGYLTAEAARHLIEQDLDRLTRVRAALRSREDWDPDLLDRLETIESKLTCFQARRGRPRLKNVKPEDVATYRSVFRAIAESTESRRAAREIIEKVLEST